MLINDKELRLLETMSPSKTKSLNKILPQIEGIRNEKGIENKVEFFTLRADGYPRKQISTLDDYIMFFEKMCNKYKITLKEKYNLSNLNVEAKQEVVKKIKSYFDILPPELVKQLNDIESVYPILQGIQKDTPMAYLRISNEVFDWMNISTSKNWWSCTNYREINVGANTPIMYSVNKYDRVVFGYETELEAKTRGKNPIFRFIISEIDDSTYTHRLYGDSESQLKEDSIRKLFLEQYKNAQNVDTKSILKVQNPGLPRAYPDIAHTGVKISHNFQQSHVKKMNVEYNSTPSELMIWKNN